MVAEVLEQLDPSRGGVFVDCTVGLGGHARALLDAGATRLIGFDRDPAAVEAARTALKAFGERVEVVHADYRRLNAVLDERGVGQVNGLLADLGISSMQAGPTAAEALRGVDERTLADLIYEFGEERHSRRIARAIVAARERASLETTRQLADIVRRAIPRKGYSRIDPATRTFQAIRIWVNRELEGLDGFLGDAARRLAVNGRMAVITFHSLEDRIAKHTLRALQAEGFGLWIRTKRPVVPGEAEIGRNPRARSAKLRAAEIGQAA